jgi:hypothetical protein
MRSQFIRTWAVLALLALASGAWAQGRRPTTLAQQKMCADQAKKFFDDLVAPKPSKAPIDPLRASYVDHYDAKANICYVAIVRNDTFDRNQKITYSTDVFDAFEGTSYATYTQLSDNIRSGIEVKPPLCYVEPRRHSQIICKSEDEFDGLIEEYFGLVVR